MSDTNPFGGLGGEGGFDLNAMLEQAQQMQAQLVAAQEELAATTVEGAAGGVTVKLTGTGELTDVGISAGSFDGSDADSLTDLGDLVVAAYRDGKAKVDELASRTLGPLAGGGPGADDDALPGGFGV
jgi:nucleoid-associated protein EbfC